MGITHAWRSLRHRNFRLWVTGQSISITGTWMTRVAMAWLVYRLTQSPWMLGALGFASQIPMFLVTPFSGVLVDRMDRRKVLLWAQILLMLHALTLAALTLTHTLTVPILFLLAVVQGLITTFDMPARLSFFVRMVDDPEDLPNALAVNAAMSNATRLMGPSLAGLLIAVTNEGWCFLADGISYMAVIASLLMMRMGAAQTQPARAGVITQLREGWSYVVDSLPLRNLLLLFGVVCLMGLPFSVLMPVFAVDVLHGGPNTLGFLMGALGLGALASSLSLVMRRSVRGLIGQLPLATAIAGCGLICVGFSHSLYVSLALMFVTGYGLLREGIGTNTLLQTITEESMRARVMSYYSMAMEGLAPFGSLLAGALAHRIGAPHTVLVTGALCLAGALWFGLERPGVQAVALQATA